MSAAHENHKEFVRVVRLVNEARLALAMLRFVDNGPELAAAQRLLIAASEALTPRARVIAEYLGDPNASY